MKKYINISDVLWFQEGPGVRNTQYTTDGVKLLNVTNLINGNVDTTNTNRYISKEEAYGKYKHFLADEGDLVIASSGIKVEYFDKKMGFIRKEQLPLCMNTSTIRFKVTDEKRLSIRYFMYYLKSNHFKEQLGQQITGSAQLNFGPSHLKKMVFPLIEMEEQAKIIDKLDTIYDIEYKMRTELKLYDQLASSLFIEMFGDPIYNSKNWQVVQIGDIAKDVRYGTSNPAVEGGKYPYLRMNNITVDGKLDLGDLKYIDISDYELEKYVVRKGDLLFNRTNSIELVGKTTTFNLNEDMIIAGYIIRVRLNNQMLPEVLSQYMNLEVIKSKLRDMAKGAVNQANINAQELQSIRVYLPDIDIQKKFVKIKCKLDKSKYSSFSHLSA